MSTPEVPPNDETIPASSPKFVPTLTMVVYGGKKDDVTESLNRTVGESDATHAYQTWVNVSALRRLGLLFQGGAESSGAISDLLCLVTVIAAIVFLFFFWQFVVFFITIVVLGILSGGAAFKYLRGTYIEADAAKVNLDSLEEFVKEQLKAGHFVMISSDEVRHKFGPTTNQSRSSTMVFRYGIYWSLFVATLLVIVELVYWFLNAAWLFDVLTLGLAGAGFLMGVAMMDLGVLLRWQLARGLKD
ncbi:MAG: hypothetical protein ACXADL_09885 [Candidatus Thorarchaeota archaeon]|jgi:hypothetical protein